MNEAPLPEPLESFLQSAARACRRTRVCRKRRCGERSGCYPVRAGGGVGGSWVLRLRPALSWRSCRPISPGRQAKRCRRKRSWSARSKPAPVEPKPAEEPKPPVAVIAKTNPLELEWQAFDAPDDPQRVRLYFLAGNLYLDKHDDYASAVRCYSQALDYCDTRDMEINPDDNWLVMALKRDRRKEP